MFFGSITPLAPLQPAPPQGRPCWGWMYPKMKIIIEIPTIENPRIDVSHVLWWYNSFSPPAPPPKVSPCRSWGYPKMKMKIIFEFLTIENPRIDITHYF